MDKEPLLRISHLQKHFGKFQALKDINFEINAGKFLALSVRMVLVNQLLFGYYLEF